MRLTVLAVFAMLAAAFPVTNAQDAPPSLRILEPAEGAILGSSTVVVRVAASGVELVDAALADPAAKDEAHLHYLVDGKGARAAYPDGHRTADARFVVTGLRPGPHTITVELRDREHRQWAPATRATVNVTVAAEAPYVVIERPEPGQRTEGQTTRAQARVERAGGFLMQEVTVRWTLDGQELPATGLGTADVPPAAAPGVRTLRAELVRGGRPLSPPSFDTVLLDIPRLAWASAPQQAVASLDAPAQVPFAVSAEGWAAEPAFAVTGVDGVDEVRGTSFTFPLAVGEHRIVLRLLDAAGKPVAPVVVLAHDVRVVPPPPEVRFVSPKEMTTTTASFYASIEVANFTLGEGAGPYGENAGHVHWYLDGEKVEDSTALRVRFDDLGVGRHVLEARLSDVNHREIGAKATRNVYVDVPPGGGAEEAQGEDRTPAPGLLAALAAVGAAVAAARRR